MAIHTDDQHVFSCYERPTLRAFDDMVELVAACGTDRWKLGLAPIASFLEYGQLERPVFADGGLAFGANPSH